MASTPFFRASIKTHGITIVPADTTAKKTIYTAGASGGKVVALLSATDDTANELCFLWLNDGTTDLLIGCKTIPLTAGFVTTVPTFNWFDGIQIPGIPIDRDGQRFLELPANGILKISAAATITAAKTIYTTAIAADY